MIFRFSILFFFLTTCVNAQTIRVKGVVVDHNTKEPLAFVNIVAGNHQTGTTTDIDGKFVLKTDRSTCCLRLSYMGYQRTKYTIDLSKPQQIIEMIPRIIHLQEVVVLPGINPAHRIIDSVLRHKNENDPRKLKAFTYTSYDKVILTAKADSLLTKDTALLDSSAMKAREFLKKQDLFLLETVTNRKYMAPGLNQENVLASKVSGFKDPVIVFMISQIQSTTFYDEQIKLFDKNYINPISRGSKRKYFFQIEDTTYTAKGDTVFVISYRPLLHTHFDGLKGFLSINTHGWAIQNVKAEPAHDTTGIIMHIQQAYHFIQGHWFPVQLNTNIDFLTANIDLGGTVYPMTAIGKSYIRDINLHPSLKKSDFSYHEVEIAPDAIKKSGEFWKKFRVDSLTARDKETYRVIDSIGKAANFDKFAAVVSTLMSGHIPAYFLDVDIDKFIHYNQYEGLYLGIGAHTNQQISKRFSLGGYWGYGFHDKTAKYGLNTAVILNQHSETSLYIAGYHDVEPMGGIRFEAGDQRIWNTNDFYTFYYRRMNLTSGGEATLSFRTKMLRDFKWYFGLRAQNKTAFGTYFFQKQNEGALSHFKFREAFFDFRFAFREKMIQTTKGYFSMGSRYPVIFLKYTHGFKSFMNGDFRYDRIDLKIEHTLHINYLGDFSYRIMAGMVVGAVPACNLFDGNGTYRPFALFAPNSFGTMRPNEFLSDRYIDLFLTHNFGHLLFKGGKVFNPQLMLITNIAFGGLKHKAYHHNYSFKTLEKGYYESGIVIRKLLDFQIYDLGLGVTYRYGPYGFKLPAKNFAYKVSIFYRF